MSVNTAEVVKNAWRITSQRGLSALRVRVPGGHLAAKHLPLLQEIAERYGNGTLHITIRQGFEIPGIPFAKIPEVNRRLRPLLTAVETAAGVALPEWDKGYPAAGTRNISACIGNRVCPYANYDTTALAQRLEREVYPNHYHVKIACTGCPNDCVKAHMQDFGVIGMTEPQYDESRCISCGACERNCRRRVTGALSLERASIRRDPRRCIGCGECCLLCPTGALTRSREKHFALVILGRTGKRNPRLAMPFLRWVPEDAVVRVIKNVYAYIEPHIDRSLKKEHVGYIVERTGFPRFKEAVLKGVDLGPKGQVAREIQFGGYWYERDVSFDGPAQQPGPA
ncbi:MAG: sulfite reductase subunit C [Lentisphaeria bacterium]|jgi:anaerobic sulfite reductase subunit C